MGLVSNTSTGSTGNSFSGSATVSPAISADGAFVTFRSLATDLVAGQSDVNGNTDVFLFERASGAVTLVSHLPASSTTAGNGLSVFPSISADGAFVAFRSFATNPMVGQSDANATSEVFLFERATGAVTLVSHLPASSATTGNGLSDLPSISADGTFVAFRSNSTNLVAGQSDANAASDVFLFARKAVRATPADFDGNGATDIAVFRPSTGQWLIRNQPTVFHGTTGDIAVPCDYNGTGGTDVAVLRPSVGGWYVVGQPTVFHGLTGDIPVPGDYNGDGRCEIAVFRPSVGGWYIAGQAAIFFGLSGDIATPGDYDANGSTDIAVYRPSVGGWYRNGAPTTFFGLNGDVPVPGDYDGTSPLTSPSTGPQPGAGAEVAQPRSSWD